MTKIILLSHAMRGLAPLHTLLSPPKHQQNSAIFDELFFKQLARSVFFLYTGLTERTVGFLDLTYVYHSKCTNIKIIV